MKPLKIFTITLTLLSSILLSACATPANYQAMVVSGEATTHINQKLKNKLSVRTVSGGKSTNPIWASQVDNTALKKALEDSFKNYGYLAPSSQKPSYVIDANLENLDQPMFGLDMTVTSSIEYTLSEPNGAIKKYLITTPGTATTSDNLYGASRLRNADEKSIKANIAELLKRLEAS